ncbi:uncharacterized protein [Leptinotarsa decemlineata]|uniref:uncharacterized protein n=1 Tax=Leptinotarsa decemlineata TaxID=7539 RepID=UPI003D30C377
MREEEKALTQTVHDVHHLEITCSSGHELKDNYSEDDDDSIRDPNYEAVSDESSISDYEPTSSKHVVGDSDHVVADSDSTDTPLENKVNEARPKKRKKKKIQKSKQDRKEKKRNSNEKYYNYKGREIRPKEFINYDCNCTLKCAEHVPVEIRKLEFERFWSLGSYDCQVNIIAATLW